MPVYTVQQGDYLAKIAKAHGFHHWKDLYFHPSNAEFRAKRPDPNVIYPGDEIVIPGARGIPVATGRDHTIPIERPGNVLRLNVGSLSGREPLAAQRYTLTVGERTYESRIPESGVIEHWIPTDAETAELAVHFASADQASQTWDLKIGHLDPVNTVSGIQGRLNNLGFSAGPVDGDAGPLTEAAVKRFQTRHGLVVDGIAGPITQRTLQSLHGC